MYVRWFRKRAVAILGRRDGHDDGGDGDGDGDDGLCCRE